MRWRARLVVTLSLLCAFQTVRAQTYYVANSGSDSNAGTSAAPWATIQAFGNVGKAGDTLIVRAGTYAGAIFGWDGPNQGLYSQISGTAASPIVIEADPNAAPGSVVITSRNSKNAVGFDLEPGCDYVNIIGFKITNPGGSITKAGLEVAGSTGNQVLNNTIDGVGGVGGILIDTSVNVLIQGNTCIHVVGTGTTGHGMYLSGSSVNCTIRGNFLHDNDYVGLHINGDLSEGAPGIVNGAIIESNYIYNNGQNAINADGLQNSTIRNNLIYNYARSGIVLYQIDAAGPGKNNKIYNNTIAAPQSGAEAAIRIVSGGTGNIIFNNVLLGSGNIFLAMSTDSLPGLVCDYNAVSGLEQNDDTGATQSLAQWQAAGHDTHSFTTTAANMFVSTTDYHLKSGSPAIDTGTASLSSVSAPTTDLEGNPRPSGAGYDIGCYEVQATSGAPSITTTSPLPAGTVNAAYSKSFAASGGTGPYTYTISAGSAPAGLTLSSAGTLSGTPTTAGTATFTVQVKDSANATATKQFQLTINAVLSITTTSLAQGTVNAAYSQTLALSGGTSPFTWSITSGSLPAGLTLNASTGAISGTPTASASSSITFKVTDTAGATASKALTLTINAALSITSTSPLTGGTVGTAYSATLAASGGAAPLTWSVSSGTLPAGVTLNSSSGVLSGTPTTAGTANFTVKVADAAGASTTKAFGITITAKLAITTVSPLPAGAVNVAYSQTLAATGGTKPYTWSLASGTLPAGLSLSSGGVLSGTPTAAGTSNFSVKVSDSASASATQSFALTISLVSITTASPLPAGTTGAAYSQSFAASGGTQPYTWTVASGTLPAGLSLSSAGVLSGTPTTAGTSNFTLKAADSSNAIATKAFALTINAKLVLTTISVSPASATVKKGGTQQFTATGLDQNGNPLSPQPAVTWSVSGGGTISTTGLFTATSGGRYTVTASSGSVSGAASVRVNAPPTLNSAASTANSTIVINTSATFTAGAVDPNGGTLTYAWDFGDGTSGSGATAPHVFTALGNYTVTVSISDDSGDVTVSTVAVTVVAGAQPPPLPMTVSKLAGVANFKTGGRDAFVISGTLPNLPAGLVLAGQTLTLNVGGASATFTLDKNGHGKNAQGTFALRLKTTRSVKTHVKTFAGGDGTFTASLRHGTWAAGWGMDPNASASNAPLTLDSTVQFLGNVYEQVVAVRYSAKAGMGGKFKK